LPAFRARGRPQGPLHMFSTETNTERVTMREAEYAFPLAIQTTLPRDYQDRPFLRQLELLRKFGFSGVELNIVQPERVDPAALVALLAGFDLKMTMFATGGTAKPEGLSLSSLDDEVRQASVQRCTEFVDFAHEMGAGVIVGYLKGGVSAEPARARECFVDSLTSVEPHVRAREVPLLIEATNRYESAVANALADTADLIRGFDNPYLRILPDTFHMNIEERSLFGSLIAQRGLYDSVHLSDNNRLFPGLGALDFRSILRFLSDSGFEGGVAIEGNVRESFEQDLMARCSHRSRGVGRTERREHFHVSAASKSVTCRCEQSVAPGRHSMWDDITDRSLRRAQRGSNLLLLRGRLLRHSVPRSDRHHVISRHASLCRW